MKDFNKKLQERFKTMCDTGRLFRVALTGNQVWNLYLHGFGIDTIFRDPESSEHNCNHCKNFIRRYGNIVAISGDNTLMTLFDVELMNIPREYISSASDLSEKIKASEIINVFFETFDELKSLPYESCKKDQSIFRLGIDKNVKRYTKEEAEKFGVVKPNEIRTFNHMHLDIPKQFVDHSGKSVENIMGEYRSKFDVFKRAMTELSLATLEMVKDLINQGSLLDGTSHVHDLETMIKFKKTHDSISYGVFNWYWDVTYNMNERTAKFKNHLIGVLCTEIEAGEKGLERCCLDWNKRVDPANFMKATAPITKKQIAEAEKFLIDNNYVDSFNRRHAKIDDILVSEIKHINTGSGALKTFSMFDSVKPTQSSKEMNFDHVVPTSVEAFMSTVLPNCKSVEVYMENRMANNMTNLTTAIDQNCKSAFKWNNPYSWTFNGNLAGKSMIAEAVKTAGGKIDGVLRFSIMWNEDGRSIVDFDAHCSEADGHEIYYADKHGRLSGSLDIDMISPIGLGVENIVYTDLSRMRDGEYHFYNHNFNDRNNTGFKAQIAFGNQIFDYEVIGNMRGNTKVASVRLRNGIFTIEHHLPHTSISKDIYGLESNQFHKVSLVSVSPNHWGQNAVGNKYYFFMLEGCRTSDFIRSFHIENLNAELAEHRKVMEVVGNVNMLSSEGDQLAGLGFNTTVKDTVVVRVDGKHLMKIQF